MGISAFYGKPMRIADGVELLKDAFAEGALDRWPRYNTVLHEIFLIHVPV